MGPGENFWSEGQKTLKPGVLGGLFLWSLEPHLVIQGPVLNRNIIIANNSYISNAYHWSHSVGYFIHIDSSSYNYPSR